MIGFVQPFVDPLFSVVQITTKTCELKPLTCHGVLIDGVVAVIQA